MHVSLRFLFSLAATLGLKCIGGDFSQAYINADLPEDEWYHMYPPKSDDARMRRATHARVGCGGAHGSAGSLTRHRDRTFPRKAIPWKSFHHDGSSLGNL